MLKVARTVLIVDDDVEILHLARDALNNFLRWNVTSTPNPEYAFELALRMEFDLFIFDLSMPRLDGEVLYNLIRTAYTHGGEQSRRMPPLLLMTGFGGDARSQELLRTPGVRGLLSKPYSIQTLLDKVESCLPDEDLDIPPKGDY